MNNGGFIWIAIAALAGAAAVIFDLAQRSVGRRRRLSDPSAPPEMEELYEQLRLGALTETLGHLGLAAKGEGAKAFGLVIDLRLGEAIVTLSTLITGDVSLYASDGGGTLGGIDEPAIRAAAVTAIKRAEAVMADMTPTTVFPFPATGHARFYLLLSDRRVVTADDTMETLAAGGSDLSPAWNAAHKVFERLGVAAPRPSGLTAPALDV